MSTVPLNCPKCGRFLRVAVQPSQVMVLEDRIHVMFDSQTVAHICNPADLAKQEKKY